MNELLSRLEGVREVGNGQFYAKCPSHDDGSPSLSIKETDDGTLLVHCFAGCESPEVVEAVGMTLSDLFPDSFEAPSRKAKHNPRDLLKLLSFEATFLLLCANHMRAGRELSDVDLDRLGESVRKITAVRDSL